MKTIKAKSIDEYISQFPDNIQQRLTQIRETINRTMPNVEEKIRYGMPAFKLGKEHIYISAYAKHIGMYPMYGMEALEKELVVYRGKNTKDALHFPHKQPLPFPLIVKIVKHKIVKK
jgi:uncharacterized protein YdhG (YjbR/CyaY superfamily)